MNEIYKAEKSTTYQVKVQNGYVKNVWMAFREVAFTSDLKRSKHLTQEEVDYVLEMFPEAETRKYNATLERVW